MHVHPQCTRSRGIFWNFKTKIFERNLFFSYTSNNYIFTGISREKIHLKLFTSNLPEIHRKIFCLCDCIYCIFSGESQVYTTGRIGKHRVVSTKLSCTPGEASDIAAGNSVTRLLGIHVIVILYIGYYRFIWLLTHTCFTVIYYGPAMTPIV